MEVKNQNVRKINNMGIDGKVFNCRIQLFENFCHKRSLEVNSGQKKPNGGQKSKCEKNQHYGY